MAEKNTKKESILSNWVVKNLIWAVVFVVGLAIVVSVLLGIVTQHNKEIVVPDFTNMTFSEAKYNAERAGIRVQISDSVYVRRMKKG